MNSILRKYWIATEITQCSTSGWGEQDSNALGSTCKLILRGSLRGGGGQIGTTVDTTNPA